MEIEIKRLESEAARQKILMYVERLEQLYTDIRVWLAKENLLVIDTGIDILEQMATYQVTGLSVQTQAGKVLAEIQPAAASVIVAEGRIDVVGWLGTEYLLYMLKPRPELGKPLYKGLNQDAWYWIEDSYRNRAHRLEKSLLLELITLVSDYEFD
ncbi:hypothetical protein PN36_24675 [Candidatus Thiomargarita nelsonii]|uniref:Uncharacterized protein n=1 Tax=Candidatus Thiomargarita nelsonii TaxID=1003181 RepID=A0A0A6S064_9GAMM|nr:hypothetical protein PN36_24675 [Candidatus Thiomargarita nelsonii]